jgi:hypothetical protein
MQNESCKKIPRFPENNWQDRAFKVICNLTKGRTRV